MTKIFHTDYLSVILFSNSVGLYEECGKRIDSEENNLDI